MKKIWIVVITVVILIVAGVFVYQKKKESILGTEWIEDIKVEDISYMEISVISLETYVAFNDRDAEKISEVMEILKKIEAKSSKYQGAKGCGTTIDIIMKDNTEHTIILAGEDMFIDGTHYTPDNTYLEEFRNLVNKYNTVNPVADMEESQISHLELNTSINITIRLNSEKSERISQVMEILKNIKVKSVKYPTFRCDTSITIKMKDGTEYSLGFGSEDMVVDGKYYTPDGNYKEILNEWAYNYDNGSTTQSNTEERMESIE